MKKIISALRTNTEICLLMASLGGIGSVAAQDLSVEGVSPYFCGQLGGSASGGICRAPYEPYRGGNACSIYNSIDDKYPSVREWMERITNSCSSDLVTEAKKRTLKSRASLRGYVSAGNDESVNDPVATPSYRPEGATLGSGEAYFAAECAIRTCGGSSLPPVSNRPPPNDSTQPPSVPSPPIAPSPPAAAAPPPSSPPRASSSPNSQSTADDNLKAISFKLCNRTGESMFAAFIYRWRPTDRSKIHAWYKIEPNQCHEVKILRDHYDPAALIYYYAHSKRGVWDGTNEPIYTTRCLSSDVTERYVDDPYECRSSDIKRRFAGVRFKDDYTVDLTAKLEPL